MTTEDLKIINYNNNYNMDWCIPELQYLFNHIATNGLTNMEKIYKDMLKIKVLNQ
jgi:hypothetical protein